jgi:SlyX protein
MSPMSEEKLSQRIDALETKLMFQEDTIEVLNQTITMQWHQIDALKRQIADLSDRLREAEAGTGRPANERPPHY